MISYELALQLKNAGFPQDNGLIEAEKDKERFGWFTCEGSGDAYIDKELFTGCGAFANELWTGYHPYQESVYVPTLSELIKACGDRTILLKKWSKQASRPDNKPCFAWVEGETFQAIGSTLEEAVANLYLALNKK